MDILRPGSRVGRHLWLLIGLFSMMLAGCSGGGQEASSNAPPAPPPSQNGPPTISGGPPPASINSGTAYSFQPSASDPDGDPLTFSIQNKPAWATFSTSTGRLSGTPAAADVGTYSNIAISVSDGALSASLSAFAVAVTQVSSGSATLSWAAPTQNTDGSPLTNLAGFRIYYGTNSGSLSQTVQIANPGLLTYMVQNLSPATWFFAVKAYNSSGVESSMSNTASKTIQ